MVKGGPATRCGGSAKKSSDAAIAEAADSEVPASLPTAAVSAVCRLAAVTSLVAPMANWFGPGLAEVVAVSVMLSVEPSGSVKRYWMVSPSFGLTTPRSTVEAAGGPDGVTVAPLKLEVTPASLSPNGETASSASRTEVTVGAEISRRPRPLAPRSAWLRSAIICLRPARAPSPFMMRSMLSTAGWSLARPENR